MSATADKARFFLEQSVPELKEFERKKIFDTNEITAIAKKRSDFEHKINARGSTPGDYAQYAEFEMNVDALRKKRVKRLGIKSTTHNGQRRIFFVLDRGTRKFPGDIGIWMQSIEYAKRQKAYKKMTQLLTHSLRLHPTKAHLWIYAARAALEEQADITEARGYMQRGLRFCKSSKDIWREYLRLEMSYIAKIHTRRQILGIGSQSQDVMDQLETEDFLRLSHVSAKDIAPTGVDDDIDGTALQTLDSAPIMSEAIPIAIFDASIKQFDEGISFIHDMIQVILDFDDIPIAKLVLLHMERAITRISATDWRSRACGVASAVTGFDHNSSEFPSALRVMLQRLSASLLSDDDKKDFVIWSREFLDRLLQWQIDPALHKILQSKRHSLDD